ncbi:hypothetical protein OSB04_027748 [Centaurea solstitialis]|uniref:Copper ion binding protein n=1 Tax=Centaurea solstitialis TaxID=347529 RepID=A0AA38SXY7_9ASTR|nr:hypothetical protein OSB04_027748 [Centaurea solstitialis]
MATRQAVRYVSRRFSSSGKILSEEEKAAENIYIKPGVLRPSCAAGSIQPWNGIDDDKGSKTEQEKLEKLARKGQQAEATSGGLGSGSGAGAESNAKASESISSTGGVSSDKNRNYAVIAGVVAGFGALGWYLNKEKKTEELHD